VLVLVLECFAPQQEQNQDGAIPPFNCFVAAASGLRGRLLKNEDENEDETSELFPVLPGLFGMAAQAMDHRQVFSG
jgi:hypothetical protein